MFLLFDDNSPPRNPLSVASVPFIPPLNGGSPFYIFYNFISTQRKEEPSITASLFQGDPPLMSMAQLIVEVVDVNENNFAPVFDDFVARGWVKENQDVTRVMQVRITPFAKSSILVVGLTWKLG